MDNLGELNGVVIVYNAHNLAAQGFCFSFHDRCGGFDLVVNPPTCCDLFQDNV
jgi:hypothetical protein